MDIVLVTRDRPELTEQCIRSMRENAADWSRHRLVLVFDGSEAEAQRDFKVESRWLLASVQAGIDRFGPLTAVLYTGKQLGVGGAKNFGVAYIQRQLGLFNKLDPPVRLEHAENSLLMFSDNDMWYGPGWDTRLETINDPTRAERITQLGGWAHPYHQLGRPLYGKISSDPIRANVVDAATGNCFVIRWADWLRYGPFDANAIGPGQSEDYALSQRIRAGGGLVATLAPPVAIHCGLVNSVGEPATGWRECEKQITEQLAGLSAEMRNDILIMRPPPGPHDSQQIPMQTGRVIVASNEPFQITRGPGFEEPKPYRYLGTRRFVEDANRAFEKAREGLDMQPRDPIVPTRKPDGIIPRREITLDEARVRYPPHTNNDLLPTALNIASGQRPFHSTRELIWYNVDRQNIPPDRVPDIVCNVGVDPLPFDDNTIRYVVIHQGLEHAGCGESAPMLLDCWRVLARGGSLIVTVPDMRKLAARWLGGEMDTQLFMTNVYGAYMGDEADRHKWGFDQDSLKEYLRGLFAPHGGCTRAVCPCSSSLDFDWRAIPGADIARDWWVLGVEVVKP